MKSGLFRTLTMALLLATVAGTAGCSKAKPTAPDLAPSPRLKPSDVVDALQWAYKHRDPVVYGKLLGSDFQFWFDPASRPDNVPEFWTQLQDSTATGNLLRAANVSDVRITLTFGADVPVTGAGRERWRKIRVTNTFLEVDIVPPEGEVITYRVSGDVHDFYLRQGRSPGDTLTSSSTANEWFLVEWHDLARLAVNAAGPPRSAVAQLSTWSGLKLHYSN